MIEGTREAIRRALDEGEGLVDEGRLDLALERFEAARGLMPEPKERDEDAVEVIVATADVRFLRGEWGACRDLLVGLAETHPEAAVEPFVRLRLGQSLFELGEVVSGYAWMLRAYLVEGDPLFAGEDPKYLAYIESRLTPGS